VATFVRSANGQTIWQSPGASSVSATLSAPPAQGNLLVAFLSRKGDDTGGQSVPAISGWSRVPNFNGDFINVDTFVKRAGSGESATVTLTLASGTARMVMTVQEWSGNWPSNPLGAGNFVSNAPDRVLGTSTSITTTTSKPALMLAGLATQGDANNPAAMAVASPFTLRTSNTSMGTALSNPHVFVGSVDGRNGSTTASWSWTNQVIAQANILGLYEVEATPPPAQGNQFFYNFANDAVGSVPANMTVRSGGTAFSVQSSGITGITNNRALRLVTNTNSFDRIISLNALDGKANVEFVARIGVTGGSINNELFEFFMRCNTDLTTYYGGTYSADPAQRFVNLYRMVNGTYTAMNWGNTTGLISTSGQWMRMRVRINNNQVWIRAWADGATEPSTWQINGVTTTHITSSALNGIGAYVENRSIYWDWVGVGVDGASAPTSAVASYDPANLTVAVEGTALRLNCNTSPTAGVSSYVWFRRTPPSGVQFNPTTTTPIATTASTTHLDTSVVPGTTYEYQAFGRVE